MPEQAVRAAAGLSLDLDNLWSYLRSYGDHRWREYPSFLQIAVPRIVDTLAELDVRATVFVVGRDAEDPDHLPLLERLITAGHEIGNHSYDHHPGFKYFDHAQLERDFASAEAALGRAGAGRINGFRAPSFALSRSAVAQLGARGYAYDSSLFPCSIGPLARLWERLNFRRSNDEQRDWGDVYGGLGAARQPLEPFVWDLEDRDLVELPVTTMPFTRLPVHWTYLNFIASASAGLAHAYLGLHVGLARRQQLTPTLLLHGTDFLGCDDPDIPRFIPGMGRTADDKLAFVRATLRHYQRHFDLQPLGILVDARSGKSGSGVRAPATLPT